MGEVNFNENSSLWIRLDKSLTGAEIIMTKCHTFICIANEQISYNIDINGK